MVRLVGEGVEPNIYPLREALRIVEELGVDLVEIQPDANPPVCKAMDYKKFVFDQKKRLKEQKAKATKVVIKEIRLGPQTDDHDFELKQLISMTVILRQIPSTRQIGRAHV